MGDERTKSVTHGEGFGGSPGGVGCSTAGRDGPADGVTHHVSGLCSGAVKQGGYCK